MQRADEPEGRGHLGTNQRDAMMQEMAPTRLSSGEGHAHRLRDGGAPLGTACGNASSGPGAVRENAGVLLDVVTNPA